MYTTQGLSDVFMVHQNTTYSMKQFACFLYASKIIIIMIKNLKNMVLRSSIYNQEQNLSLFSTQYRCVIIKPSEILASDQLSLLF